MKRLLFFIVLYFVIEIAWTQGVQVKSVKEFSGGMVNSLSNPIMQDNQSLILDNYDITDVGALKRRKGMTTHYIDDKSGEDISAIIPYNTGYDKKLLLVRRQSGHFPDDSASMIYLLTECDDYNENCTTIIYEGYFPEDRADPFNITYSHTIQGLVISANNSEMVIYDGEKAVPARPMAAGQPKVMSFGSGGNVTGTVRYKYCYRDSTSGTYTNMSAPSWPVSVKAAKVMIYNIGPSVDSTVTPWAIIFREMGNTGTWEILDSIDLKTGSSTYLDNIASTSPADTTDFKWGDFGRQTEAYGEPPGGIDISFDTCITDSFGIGPKGSVGGFDIPVMIGYSVLFIDKYGNESYMAPATFDTLTIGQAGQDYNYAYKASLTNIPTPKDSGIVKKYILRGVGVLNASSSVDIGTDDGKWYKFMEINVDSTTYTDSLRPSYYHVYDSLYCTFFYEDPPDTTYGYGSIVITPGTKAMKGVEPENTCYDNDSIITFQPKSIVSHGQRIYAIGDDDNINSFYYSTYGQPTKFPYDKFINVPTQRGDWFVDMISLENDALLLFRQNSIYILNGLSYFQYSIDEIVGDIGLTAPRSLSIHNNNIMFIHESGLYKMSSRGGIFETPLTFPIFNSFDSISNKTRIWGGNILDEYWMSDGSKTYIYSLSPKPYWKCYNFGLNDAIMYDYDTINVDYSSDKWIFARENDTLYRWNYEDTSTTDAGVPFVATYQSKYFFDDTIREKILYLDIHGEGSCDSLLIMFYDKKDSSKDGILVRTDTLYTNFTDGKKDRIYLDNIVTRLSIKIQDFGKGDYILTGYDIGYIPWDEGIAQ